MAVHGSRRTAAPVTEPVARMTPCKSPAQQECSGSVVARGSSRHLNMQPKYRGHYVNDPGVSTYVSGLFVSPPNQKSPIQTSILKRHLLGRTQPTGKCRPQNPCCTPDRYFGPSSPPPAALEGSCPPLANAALGRAGYRRSVSSLH